MPVSFSILTMLAAVAAKVLALVALGAFAAWLLRRSSAACRHLLWAAVIGSTLAIAAAAPLPALWSIPLGDSLGLAPHPRGDSIPVPMRGPGARASGPQHFLIADRRSAYPQRSRIADALVLLWIAGATIFASRIGAGQVALRRIASRGRAVEEGPSRALLDTLAATSSVLRRVRLIETDAFLVPATWGVLRPVVALPAAARSWPSPRLEAALRHELAHVRRRDVLTQRAADVCCALFWFHPAVWFAARRMRREAERACDNTVLASGGPGIDYAEWILDLAKSISRGRTGEAPTAVAMSEGEGLEDRLRAILDPATKRRSPRALMATAPTVVLIVAATAAGLDVTGEIASAVPAMDSDELVYGERVPMSVEQEQRAMDRVFHPRDDREAESFETLKEAALHEKQHEMDYIRDRALWALSIARDDEVTVPLVEQLTNDDWRVRAYAAWGLGVVGAASAREELTTLLSDPVWRVRDNAATSLAGLDDPRSTGDMMRLLGDPAWQIRMTAVEFLSRVGSPEAQEATRPLLNDPHIAVRSAARAALVEPGT